jgi:hypothetical protein
MADVFERLERIPEALDRVVTGFGGPGGSRRRLRAVLQVLDPLANMFLKWLASLMPWISLIWLYVWACGA